MKLSKLRSLCDKAIEKYGDINVGAYSKDYAYDIEKEDDLHKVKFRVLTGSSSLPGEVIDEEEERPTGSSSLPGEVIDEEEERPTDSTARFACLFYED